MSLKAMLFVFLLLLGFISASPVRADSTVTDISEELICQCGCGMVLSNCNHLACPSRDAMTVSIEQKIAQGQSKGEIIQYFVAQYGEQVLAMPPKRGFNLIAWVLPFGALLIGGGVIYTMLRVWVRRGRHPQTQDAAELEEENDEYRRRLEKELEEFIGR